VSRQGVKGFDWHVEKVTVPAAAKHGVMQGVVWMIPKGMFQRRGMVRPTAAGIAPAVDTSAAPDHPIGRHIAKSCAFP
jgi:hypothetical protein